MANTKISALNAITGVNAASGDLIPIVDVSATETKSITRLELFTSPPAIGGTTPAAGTFTTLTSTGNAALGDAEATDTHAIKGATTILANSASAALTVTQTGAGNAFVVEDSASTDSTPFVIDGNGREIVGHTVVVSANTVTPLVQTHATSVFSGAPGAFQWALDAEGAIQVFAKSRGATPGTNVAVANNDGLGRTVFHGADGAGFIPAAQIAAFVDGTPGTNDMPGRLVFSTTADGASSPTERMRIDSGGFTKVQSFGSNLVTNTAGTYTVLTSDATIVQTTAGSTYTLPAAASYTGRKLHLVTQFAGAVISASSNVVPLIGGAAGTAILAATAGKFATLQSNGTSWLIINAN